MDALIAGMMPRENTPTLLMLPPLRESR